MDNKYEERLGTASMLPLILKMALPGFAAQLVFIHAGLTHDLLEQLDRPILFHRVFFVHV